MSKLSSSGSMSNNYIGITGSILRRNKRMECYCQYECVLWTVSDMNSVNFGKTFWDYRNYINHMNKGYNFFNWLDNKIVDERDLKIQRQKEENLHIEEWGSPY